MFNFKKFDKKIKIAVGSLIAVFIFLINLTQASPVLAQASSDNLLFGGQESTIQSILGLGSDDPRIIIASVIRVVLGFLGLIALVLVMYAGWLWMSSAGEPNKIEKAKGTLQSALIGLIIILASFGIVSFIISAFFSATTNTPFGGSGPGGAGSGLVALGNGIIGAHYPGRNAVNIPRNTKIVVTFREEMDASTIISGSQINEDNIFIYKTVDGMSGPFITDVDAITSDNKTFVFDPVDYLGSPSEKIWYSVGLATDIKKANGDAAFPGVIGTLGYDWSFEVGTFIDSTPPQVVSVIPQAGATEPRNVIIQINFNEAIDPTSASGMSASGFDNIVIRNITDASVVAGNFYISNQYRTVEFMTEDLCGTNSCGNNIYCLPGNKNLSPLIRAATLAMAGQNYASFPYDGVVDMASNSLDGDKNGSSEGPVTDNFEWNFFTNNNIDITAPVIESIAPLNGAAGVSWTANPEARFSKLLSSSSIQAGMSVLMSSVPEDPPFNYWSGVSNDLVAGKSSITIYHDPFQDSYSYVPEFNEIIRDIYQNCYNCGGP